MKESTPGKIKSKRVYTGKVVSLDLDTVAFPDGSVGELEMIRHPGASAVVPFLSDPLAEDPQILLIRQYRYAADGYLYEIPAGRLNSGESPLECAARELKEETGCTADKLDHLLSFLTTPGFTDERIHLFMATGLVAGETKHEADEFLDLEPTLLSRALRMVEAGEIVDAKTALGLMYAAGFRAGR
ncbi:MAG TPA: NUDIX hydrolase [Gemmatimonadaceae bacterium]|nr:NUDIX hydrolase [Gemmatimonadaceae bacterium]